MSEGMHLNSVSEDLLTLNHKLGKRGTLWKNKIEFEFKRPFLAGQTHKTENDLDVRVELDAYTEASHWNVSKSSVCLRRAASLLEYWLILSVIPFTLAGMFCGLEGGANTGVTCVRPTRDGAIEKKGYLSVGLWQFSGETGSAGNWSQLDRDTICVTPFAVHTCVLTS